MGGMGGMGMMNPMMVRIPSHPLMGCCQLPSDFCNSLTGDDESHDDGTLEYGQDHS